MDDTSYKGASLSAKELLSWRPLRHSADVELDGELSTLVARSRDLIRNNGIASGAIQTLVDNVIGNGLTLVVNKTEYAPDMEVEISNEKEAESLIERGKTERCPNKEKYCHSAKNSTRGNNYSPLWKM